jgi:hypothetical protein
MKPEITLDSGAAVGIFKGPPAKNRMSSLAPSGFNARSQERAFFCPRVLEQTRFQASAFRP